MDLEWLDIFIAPLFVFTCVFAFGGAIMILAVIVNYFWGG